MRNKRHQRVLGYAKKRFSCDTIAAYTPENIYYLTGFWGEGVAVYHADSNTTLIVPRLEKERALGTSRNCDIISAERGSNLISHFVSTIGNSKTCIDCTEYSVVQAICRRLESPKMLVSSNEPFFRSRMIKDHEEISTIRRTAAILDKLYQICTEKIKEGISERMLQADLICEALKMGASPASYRWTLDPLIIASGPRSALPHADVSDRRFKSGDMIIVDLTLRHKGYVADCTRTFALGGVTSCMRKVYDIVSESQILGLKAVSQGASCEDIDSICREAINQAGFKKFFVHSTGHGIGLDVHEPPWLRSKNTQKLQNNMSITVEPGIYLPGRFGVRIEDSVIVSAERQNLCEFTKELVTVG
ncbi:MAG: aminopeptidase P family protein [Thermoproteota archaeon]|nr:aminopeptidase P family protein [Thermoproteota archaeon]